MRIGAAHREPSRSQGQLFLAPGLSLVSRDLWLRNFSTTILPSGAHIWYKARDGLWCLGNIAHRAPSDPPLETSLEAPIRLVPGRLLHHPVPGRPWPYQDQPAACPLHYRPERHLRLLVFATPRDWKPSPWGTAERGCAP